jgi:hypothetical protein
VGWLNGAVDGVEQVKADGVEFDGVAQRAFPRSSRD